MSDTKPCPYCAEEIRVEAVKCRYCRSHLVPRSPVAEWTRRRENRMIAGVCAGLAEQFDLSVTVLRLAFVIAALFSGFAPAAILYLVLWVIMPLEEPGYLDAGIGPVGEHHSGDPDRPDYL